MPYWKRIQIWVSVLKSFVLSFWGIKGDFLDPEETVDEILKRRSLIRFGDGEFGIYRGKSIHYQPWSAELQEAFEEIKRAYETEGQSCSFLLAVPKRFLSVNGFKLMRKRVYVSSWAESRYDFKRNFRKDIPYGDAFLFEKNNKERYSKIWTHSSCPRNVIFIHNAPAYGKQFADTYHKNVVFVSCPSQDAFASIDEMEAAVMESIRKNGWTKEDVMLTISAGPGGKVLAYRLSRAGYWCVDAGHCWDDPLEGI